MSWHFKEDVHVNIYNLITMSLKFKLSLVMVYVGTCTDG